MRRNWMMVLCLGLAIIFVAGLAPARSEQAKQITCAGKVVDEQDQPIAGTKVTLHEMVYNEVTRSYDTKVTGKVTTGTDGAFSFSTSAVSDVYRYGYIVAEKEGLALDFATWNIREGDKDLQIKMGRPKELVGVVVDENVLNKWVKKYNIPFPVGIVQGDVEKIRFAWGVRSLPWLILTNWEQTVIAEGFGIDEMDEKLKKNIDTEHAIQKNKATPTKPVAQTGLSDPAKSFLDAEAILAGWESSYAGIRTMRVSYCTRLVDYQPPAKNPDEPPPVKYQHIERVEDGKRYHIRYSIAEDGFDRPESLMEHAFDGKTTREYWGSTTHGSIVAGLIGRNTETMNDLKVYMLLRRRLVGGRNASGTYLIEDPNSKPDLSRTLSYAIPRYMVSVLPKLESVGSQLCHVIEVIVPGKDHKGIPRQIKQLFWIAHDKGMCLMKYQWYWDNKLDREIEVEQIAMAKMDSTDVWYPKKAYRTIFSDEFGTTKCELTVTEFIPNVEVDEKTFRFDFPKGTDVFDRVRGIAGIDLPKEPPSLLGKPLPQLKDFNLKLDADKTKDKMILVCFFDMNQRPSRNCLRQLSTRAQKLKTKDIVVAAVQASKVDENTLNEWVKKYNISFPVGIVQGDVEKTRFAWGVQSLPWLILTDRKHIIRSSGFSLAELDEKIQATEK